MKRFTTDLGYTPPGIDFSNIQTYQDIASDLAIPIYTPNSRLTIDVKSNININIWVIRSNERRAGKFDDFEVIFWKDVLSGEWIYDVFNVTCDPSDVSLKAMKNPVGTAIIAYGFHKSKWQLGFHKQRPDHPALVQVKPILVYRDANKDGIIDIPNLSKANKKIVSINGKPGVVVDNTITDLYNLTLQEELIETTRDITFLNDKTVISKMQVGLFGINNHRASAWNTLDNVGLYSEGCIVHQNPARYLKFIDILKTSTKHYGETFSITVLPIEPFMI